jgi:hypothetical protein
MRSTQNVPGSTPIRTSGESPAITASRSRARWLESRDATRRDRPVRNSFGELPPPHARGPSACAFFALDDDARDAGTAILKRPAEALPGIPNCSRQRPEQRGDPRPATANAAPTPARATARATPACTAGAADLGGATEWTRERVREARRWVELYGRAPSSYDWSRSHAQAMRRLEISQSPAAATMSGLLRHAHGGGVSTV